MPFVLALAILIGACKEAADVTASADPETADPLLGEWVSISLPHDGFIRFNFTADGRVRMTTEEGSLLLFYRGKTMREWAAGFPEAEDFASAWPSDTVLVVILDNPDDLETARIWLLMDPVEPLLHIPLMAMFARADSEYNWKEHQANAWESHTRKAPLRFLEPYEPTEFDNEPGEWAYNFRGDWPTLLQEAARELRAIGFEGPAAENEPMVLRGEAGSVIYYRTHSTEKVFLSPNHRSTWKDGKWHGEKADGWISVSVHIRLNLD